MKRKTPESNRLTDQQLQRLTDIQTTEKKLMDHFKLHLKYNSPTTLTKISERVATYMQDNRVKLIVLSGPSGSGKTRCMDMILQACNDLRIDDFDSPSETKHYQRSSSLVYQPTTTFGKREKKEFITKIKQTIAGYDPADPTLENDPPTRFFIVLDELTDLQDKLARYVFTELSNNLRAWKNAHQCIIVLILTSVGGKELTKFCIENPRFIHCDAEDAVRNVFIQSKLCKQTRCKIPSIVVFPPYKDRADIIKYLLKRHLNLPVDLKICESVPSLWKGDLQNFKDHLGENTVALQKSLTGDIPSPLTLGFSQPGHLQFRNNDTTFPSVVMFEVTPETVQSAKDSVEQVGLGESHQLVSDLCGLSKSCDGIVGYFNKNIETQLSKIEPAAVLPFRSTYNDLKTDLTVYDSFNDGSRVVISANLVQLVCAKLRQMDTDIKQNRVDIEQKYNELKAENLQLTRRLTAVESRQGIQEPKKKQVRLGSRKNTIKFDTSQNRVFASYWVINTKRRKIFKVENDDNEVNARDKAIRWCEENSIYLDTVYTFPRKLK